MFEDCLLESGGVLKTQTRLWAVPALLLNTSILFVLILIPFIYPEALPKQALVALLIAPPPPASAPPSSPQQAASIQVNKMATLIDNQLMARPIIPKITDMTSDEAAPSRIGIGVPDGTGSGTGSTDLIGSVLGDIAPPQGVVKSATPRSIMVSSGVAEGNLLNKTAPIYPAIARAARIQGTVVLAAMISKSGTIEKLHVMSGPQMLQQAALIAVSTWRYKPYLLNGEPVEVETQINVIFRLGD
jgi:periplasmic protein TonB